MDIEFVRAYIMESVGLGNTSRADFCRRALIDKVNVYTDSFIKALDSLINENYVETLVEYKGDFLSPGPKFSDWESQLEITVTKELPTILEVNEIANYLISVVEEQDATPEDLKLKAKTDIPYREGPRIFRTVWAMVNKKFLGFANDQRLTRGPNYDQWQGELIPGNREMRYI